MVSIYVSNRWSYVCVVNSKYSITKITSPNNKLQAQFSNYNIKKSDLIMIMNLLLKHLIIIACQLELQLNIWLLMFTYVLAELLLSVFIFSQTNDYKKNASYNCMKSWYTTWCNISTMRHLTWWNESSFSFFKILSTTTFSSIKFLNLKI